MSADWQNGGFGIYVHWPFCQAKCPYCDFNSHVSREIDETRWLAGYLAELDHAAGQIPNRVVTSVFFGGGTPSLMHPDTVAAIIERIRKHWPMSNDPEITLEANPGSVEAGRFRGYADGGVSRISMGVQALNDRDLKRLGRIHSVEEAIAAFDIARDVFERVSFDLIYARQDQTLESWKSELNEALSLAIDHLSLYQLTIEKGTAFSDRYEKGGLRGLPVEDLAADMYDITNELCERAGLIAYEVSNYAKVGAESRHNLIYWRYGDYLGIGPGAHGRLTIDGQRFATEHYKMPNAWLERAKNAQGEKLRNGLSDLDQANEYLMMGLRISEGISVSRVEALAGRPLDRTALATLLEYDLIDLLNDQLLTTPRGRLLLNSVITELLF
ncbi:MAG: radical SAM family heme chaperone HemW [Planktotalea sp.]|uniref:radical SAM family heme chaperone HemW n=1 Tax=Planktotalea sp. TaxID=2029877 RepID=UPI003C73538A